MEESPFGQVQIEPYPRVGAEPYSINATVVLTPMHLARAHRLLVLVPEHSPYLVVDLGDPVRLDGTPIPIFEDGRIEGNPKLLFDADDVTKAGGTFVVPLTIHTTSNGRFHFGVYVAGFDENWEEFTVAPGFTAETFGRSAVSGVGHPRTLWDPPFRGDGNAVPAPATTLVFLAVVGLVGLLRRGGSRDLVDEDTA